MVQNGPLTPSPGSKIFIKLVVLLMMIVAMPALHAKAAGEDAAYEKRDVTAYIYDEDTSDTFTCLFCSDMNIPFISVTDYLNNIYIAEFSAKKSGDGTYTVSNKNGSFLVDPEKNTVHFDDFEGVVYYDALFFSEGEQAEYLEDDDYIIENENPGGLDLDLDRYDIDIAELDGDIYFPLTTIADIFSDTYQTAVYIDGEIYFDSVMNEEPYYSYDSYFDSLERDESLIDYTYNELCFSIDNFYGRPPKAEISESIKKKGFDKSLDDYNEITAEAKRLLKSESKVDFFFGLLYLDSVFDDGGHTVFSGLLMQGMDDYPDSVLSEAIEEAMYDTESDRLTRVWDYIEKEMTSEEIDDEIIATRSEAYESYDLVQEWDDNTFLIKKDKTAIFVFDEFEDSVVEPFKWSLDYAKENGIENFVVDLSANGGGSSAVAMYMLSIMTGSPDVFMKNTATGNSMTETANIDKNLDGQVDELDDEVRYDFNYAILTSQSSFSCGNLMPVYARERGIKILGEKSSGGTCILTVQYYPEPIGHAMSGTLMMVDEDGDDIDGGVEPDAGLVTIDRYGSKEYRGLYDIDNINAAIRGEEIQLKNYPDRTALQALIWMMMGALALILRFIFGYDALGL